MKVQSKEVSQHWKSKNARKNKNNNKDYGRNDEWKSQIPLAHPQHKKGIYVLNIIVQNIKTSLKKEDVKEKGPKML
jgi:collagenase-like PrtC family protease